MRSRTRKRFAALAVAGIIAGTGVAAGCDSNSVREQQFGAFDVCKQFVSRRLIAPGDAKWRDPAGDQVTYAGSGDGPWTVTASVDSQNTFGASLRTFYTCTVTNTGGTHWVLNDLTVSGSGIGQ